MTGQASGHIGTRIKAARRAQAITQNDLAKALGVREKTINRWETGRNEPQPRHLRALSIELGRSLPWLLNGEQDNEPTEAVA